MTDSPQTTIHNPATELARIIADMESRHLCASYVTRLKAVLKALRSGRVAW